MRFLLLQHHLSRAGVLISFSWSIQKALILWSMDPAERDANLVHEAVKKKEKDESYILVLIEVSCASTPDHLMAVRKIYLQLFSCSIEEDVASSPALQEPLKKVGVFLSPKVQK
jgi:hypothetical protein